MVPGNGHPPALRVVCAWCQAVLTDGPPEPTSHGICPSCRATMDRPPAPPARQPDEPISLYGCRLIAYAIEHDSSAQMTDEQIRIAIHAGPLVTSRRRPDPDGTDRNLLPGSLITINRALDFLARAERFREQDQKDAQQTTQAQTLSTGDGGTPVPVHPYPTQRPPVAGAQVPRPQPVGNRSIDF